MSKALYKVHGQPVNKNTYLNLHPHSIKLCFLSILASISNIQSMYLHTPVGIKDTNWENSYSSLHCLGTIYESKHDFSMQTWDL